MSEVPSFGILAADPNGRPRDNLDVDSLAIRLHRMDCERLWRHGALRHFVVPPFDTLRAGLLAKTGGRTRSRQATPDAVKTIEGITHSPFPPFMGEREVEG